MAKRQFNQCDLILCHILKYGAISDKEAYNMYSCRRLGARIHDLRHSHVSLLIDMGFSALAIAERVGHESIDITYRYAHLFPTRQTEMAAKLNDEKILKGAK